MLYCEVILFLSIVTYTPIEQTPLSDTQFSYEIPTELDFAHFFCIDQAGLHPTICKWCHSYVLHYVLGDDVLNSAFCQQFSEFAVDEFAPFLRTGCVFWLSIVFKNTYYDVSHVRTGLGFDGLHHSLRENMLMAISMDLEPSLFLGRLERLGKRFLALLVSEYVYWPCNQCRIQFPIDNICLRQLKQAGCFGSKWMKDNLSSHVFGCA